MEKPLLKCHKCNSVYHFPIERNWILKGVLFFLPIKVYFCSACNEQHYVWLTDTKAATYERV